jgi:hypothetical protein
VSAALAFQAENAVKNETMTDNLQPTVRVGIALGEVVVADNTITGVGVVLAQRLEQLAKPGGLCISAAIREALPARLPFEYRALGEQAVKGFDEPVRVFSADVSGGETVPAPESYAPTLEATMKAPWFLITVACSLAGVVAFVIWSELFTQSPLAPGAAAAQGNSLLR